MDGKRTSVPLYLHITLLSVGLVVATALVLRHFGDVIPGMVEFGLLLAAVAVVVLVTAVGNPVAWGTDRVDEALHGGYEQVAPTGDRLTGSLGSGRGDMYRVAWHAWRAQPVLGIGAEDFQPVYLRDRRTTNVRVIDQAEVPVGPFHPNVRSDMTFAFMAMMFV